MNAAGAEDIVEWPRADGELVKGCWLTCETVLRPSGLARRRSWRCEPLWARMVRDMPRCAVVSLYVGGEKVSLKAFTVLAEIDGSLVDVQSWKALPEEEALVRVVPIGLSHTWRSFPTASFTALASQTTSKGSKGRKRSGTGPNGWDGKNPIAVALVRAHSRTGATRAALLEALSTGVMDEKDLQAVALVKDPGLRLSALGQVALTQVQLRKLARSSEPHLRAVAAATLRDVKAREVLMTDPDPMVRGALVRNVWMTKAELRVMESDAAVALDLAGNMNARAEFLTLRMLEGGLFAQIAVMNPQMREYASALLSSGSVLAPYAACNPGVDVARAMYAAESNIAVAKGLARNVPALSRMSSSDALKLISALRRAGDLSGVISVTHHVTLSAEHQNELMLDTVLRDAALVGLAGNVAIEPEIAEMVLIEASVMYEPDQRAALVALAGNESVPSEVLNAMTVDDAMVAFALKDNEQASSSARKHALAKVRRVRRLGQAAITESLLQNSTRAATETAPRVVPALYSDVLRPLAVVLTSEENVGARIEMPKDSGVSAWGGEVLEVRIETSGRAVWSSLVLRVNERRARAAAGVNALLDPVGVMIQTPDGERFALLEPLGSRTGADAPEVEATVTAEVETFGGMLVRQVKRMATPKLFERAAMMALPAPVPTAVKGAKQVAQLSSALSGEARGADRVAMIPLDLSDGTNRLVLQAAGVERRDAVKAAMNHARVLMAAGVMSEHECAAVLETLEELQLTASSVTDRHHWAWQAREKLRFTAGQRQVIQDILNGDGPVEF